MVITKWRASPSVEPPTREPGASRDIHKSTSREPADSADLVDWQNSRKTADAGK